MLNEDIESVNNAWGSIGMTRPEYLAWERIKKFCVEALKPSHNKASPKLPDLSESLSVLNSGFVTIREQAIYRSGAKAMYEFIVGQLRA